MLQQFICVYVSTGLQSFVQVRRWGYFRFDTFSSGYVAPFWPYTGYGGGQINYEIHTADTSELLLASIDSIINEEMGTEFHGEWLLIAKWNSIPESSGISNIVSKLIIFFSWAQVSMYMYTCRGHWNYSSYLSKVYICSPNPDFCQLRSLIGL